MQASLRSVAVMALLSAACSDKSPAPSAKAEPAASAARAEGTCGDGVDELARWAETLAAQHSPLRPPPVELVRWTGPVPNEDGLVVTLDEQETWIDGLPQSSPDPSAPPPSLEHSVARAVEDGRPIYLALAPGVTWDRIAATLAAAGANGVRFGFLFDQPRRAAPPAPTALHAEIADATSLAEMGPEIAEAIQPCQPLEALVAQLARSAHFDARAFAAHVPDALAACDCAVAPATAKTLLWALVAQHRPTALAAAFVSWRPGPPDADPATVLSYPPTATWREVAPRIQELAAGDLPIAGIARVIEGGSKVPEPGRRPGAGAR